MATFTKFLPTYGQTDVARTTTVSFTVVEGATGAQIGTLAATIEGSAAIQAGVFVNGYNGTIFNGTGQYVVGIYPKSPSFLSSAAQIDVHMEVLDAYGSLDAYNYSFFTAGYTASADDDPAPDVTPRSCDTTTPSFTPTDLGLSAIVDQGNGTEVEVSWKTATPSNPDNIIFYNLYFDTSRLQVFDGYPDFLVADTTAVVGGLRPGDQQFFGVRVSEFNPLNITLTGLTQAGTDMYYYPDDIVSIYFDQYATFVPAVSVAGFPSFGMLVVNDELIRYDSKQVSPAGFNVSSNGRGYSVSGADPHQAGAIIRLYWGKEDTNTIIAQASPSFQKPNLALTQVLGDGYGDDGFRDGYDGYATSDGYERLRQEEYDSITTDGTNNDEQGEFPRFDYCGTWRSMSPQNFLQGQCRNSYIGGAQMRVDGSGSRHLVKVPDFQTHMLQREELLLEQTGEPFVLARRMWTGMRCSCVMMRRGHQDARCPICFVPDTLVNTRRGFIPICNIQIGEEVLTDDGSYRKVINIMERDYDGYMVNIKTHTTNSILVTPEHPFLTVCSDHNIVQDCGPKCDAFIKNGDGAYRHAEPRLLPSGNWWARITEKNGNRVSLGTFKEKSDANLAIKTYYKINILPQHRLDWKNAVDLTASDWLENKWSKETYDVDDIVIPDECTKQTNLGSLRNGVTKFKVDEEFLWIVGIYLAEGSAGTRQVNFSLHSGETEFQNKIVNYFYNLGFNSNIRKTSNYGVNVEIHSTTLSQWFSKLFGKKSYHKEIPQIFMNLPNNKIKHIIKGIYDGDGNKSCNEVGQTSKILALQIIEILHRLGKQPHLRFQQSKTLTPIGNKRRLCYIVSWEEESFDRINRRNGWNLKRELLTKIKQVSRQFYSGKVYNLEVEGRHTYVIENIVVHNCFGTGFTQGYIQFFNPRRSDRRILVRVDPAVDDVNIVDRGGLEPQYEPGAWTLPFPAVKDRDVLVRFNEDNSEEFRYEILNVTRQRVMFTQSGAQKFTMKRFPKTDLMYQFPVVRDTSPTPGTLTTSTTVAPGLIAHSHQIIVPLGTSLTTLKGATLESEGHNHVIFSGIVQAVLGHTHTI